MPPCINAGSPNVTLRDAIVDTWVCIKKSKKNSSFFFSVDNHTAAAAMGGCGGGWRTDSEGVPESFQTPHHLRTPRRWGPSCALLFLQRHSVLSFEHITSPLSGENEAFVRSDTGCAISRQGENKRSHKRTIKKHPHKTLR